MANLGNFDATQIDPTQSYDPLPAGEYRAIIVESEVGETKKKREGQAQEGTILKLTWEVIEGEFEGRRIFDNINLANDNQQAVEIGQRQLSGICHATGRLQVSDSEQLHNIPCILKVKVRPAKGDFEASNDIKEYKPDGAAVAGQVQQQSAPVAAARPQQAAPPWRRSA